MAPKSRIDGGATTLTQAGRPVVLLTEREAIAVLDRLQAVMTRSEQGANNDLGRAVRVLRNQVGWIEPQAHKGMGRNCVSEGVA